MFMDSEKNNKFIQNLKKDKNFIDSPWDNCFFFNFLKKFWNY